MSKQNNSSLQNVALLTKKVDKMSNKIKALEEIIQQKKILSVVEIREKYGISRSTIDRYRKKGLKVGQPTRNGQIYIDEIELQNFLKNIKRW